MLFATDDKGFEIECNTHEKKLCDRVEVIEEKNKAGQIVETYMVYYRWCTPLKHVQSKRKFEFKSKSFSCNWSVWKFPCYQEQLYEDFAEKLFCDQYMMTWHRYWGTDHCCCYSAEPEMDDEGENLEWLQKKREKAHEEKDGRTYSRKAWKALHPDSPVENERSSQRRFSRPSK